MSRRQEGESSCIHGSNTLHAKNSGMATNNSHPITRNSHLANVGCMPDDLDTAFDDLCSCEQLSFFFFFKYVVGIDKILTYLKDLCISLHLHTRIILISNNSLLHISACKSLSKALVSCDSSV